MARKGGGRKQAGEGRSPPSRKLLPASSRAERSGRTYSPLGLLPRGGGRSPRSVEVAPPLGSARTSRRTPVALRDVPGVGIRAWLKSRAPRDAVLHCAPSHRLRTDGGSGLAADCSTEAGGQGGGSLPLRSSLLPLPLLFLRPLPPWQHWPQPFLAEGAFSLRACRDSSDPSQVSSLSLYPVSPRAPQPPAPAGEF